MSTPFFLIWGYADPHTIMKMNAMLMKMSEGGVTLDYIDNYMTPFDRDEYWYTYVMMEKEKLERMAKQNENNNPNGKEMMMPV